MLKKDPRFCHKILWSGESKFKLFQSDGTYKTSYIIRPPSKALDPSYIMKTVKPSGDSIMAWAVFSWRGVAAITRIEGIKDQNKSILDNVMESYFFEISLLITFLNMTMTLITLQG